MIQYLIILLDDTSVSFCHYEGKENGERRLMPLETLKQGIVYGMKENLNIQFVYPDYDLPQAYKDAIDTIDHTDIKPVGLSEDADVVVIDGWKGVDGIVFDKGTAYVVRTSMTELLANRDAVKHILERADRLNVVITDLETFTEDDFQAYKEWLSEVAKDIEQLYVDCRTPQLNLLTDRMMLDKMNNCGAGDTTLTLAPDGRFYVCPAFYLHENSSEGSLSDGLDIKNVQLYRLDHAPLCRNCDAYQCRRCIWLNRKTTLEVNTPSHEQCVVSHLERNASRTLLINIRKHGTFLPEREEIKEIKYLDPFEVRKEW